MTNVLDLFRGVGVIIDDALKSEKETAHDGIWEIKKSFEDKNIPLLTYFELPDNNTKNFNSISFLLLDWDLIGLEQGIDLPQAAIDDNITFIQQFNDICFVPIFIFSNESKESIEEQLVMADLYDDKKSNNIFIKSKSDFVNVDLFTVIEEWIKQTPSIYVLKEWELSLQQGKNSLFWDFYHINPEWAKILYETINKDGGDLSYEMSDILFENLKTRTLPVNFDTSILSASATTTITPDEIKQVLEGQRFRKHNLNMIFTGDVFLKDGKYYINVRPQCDCISRKEGETIDNVKIYLIEGKEIIANELTKKQKSKLIDDSEISKFVTFPINGGKFIQFDFKEFAIVEFRDYKPYRIGTLLPPFITKLIQKYAAYMQRQGLPRIPEEAMK
ncbi:MAG: hypothetical protein LBJ98_00855 [Endomicrobium sp.]|jgi:hypothetical protein|nr:hypothetical protein [Endomicrobium sp.]